MILAIGDSVMQGAGADVYATLPAALPGVEVRAAPTRQLRHAAAILRHRLATGPPPDAVVVHLGTNGAFSDAAFDGLGKAAAPIGHLVVVTVKAPRPWEAEVNDRLVAGADRHGASLVDWHGCAEPEHLTRDGFHLTRAGAVAYAAAIAAAVLVPRGRAGKLAT